MSTQERLDRAVASLEQMLHTNSFVRAAVAGALRRNGLAVSEDNRAALLLALAEKLINTGGRHGGA